MPAEADFAVIEIGMNHPGEIAPLARLAKLDVAVVTIVAPAHLEAFDSVEGIAHEKAAIMDGLVSGGVAVLNADLTTTAILLEKAAASGARQVLFGTSAQADWRILSVELSGHATIVRATAQGSPLLFKVASPGRHFAHNAIATLAVAQALGCDPAIAAGDIGRWSPPTGRGTRERIQLDPVEETAFDLFDDAFNANPASMAAALDVLIAAEPQHGVGRHDTGRRIAILGDMLELGPTEAALHAAIASHPGLQAVTTIHCVGPRMKALWQALPRGQKGEWVETAPELAIRARHLVDAGDVVLVKGSKGSKVSLVVDGLRKLGQAVAAQDQGAE
jgi:UDP-N-acetylmuramoyl-tripeptide--D-alanyl-D-alanine ligase